MPKGRKKRSKLPPKSAYLEGYQLRSRDTRYNKPKNKVEPKPGVNWLEILPREIRDMIYEYALTEPNGLCNWTVMARPDEEAIHFSINSESESASAFFRDANQLRLVNRQLYKETKGLSIRFNDLNFIDPWRDQENNIIHNDTFTRFISTVDPKHAKYLNRISVIDTRTRPSQPEPNIISLKLGVNSPILHLLDIAENVMIITRFDWQDRLPWRWLNALDGLSNALPGMKAFSKKPFGDKPFREDPSKEDGMVGLIIDESDLGWSDELRSRFTPEFLESEIPMIYGVPHADDPAAGVVEETVQRFIAVTRDMNLEVIR